MQSRVPSLIMPEEARASKGLRPLKTVSIIISKNSLEEKRRKPEESFSQLPAQKIKPEDLVNLRTCVPYHLEDTGLLVNDVRDDAPECDDYTNPSDFPTPTRAPSDDLLFRAPHATRQSPQGSSKIPVGINTELTVDQLRAGLKNIGRVGNGYHLNYSHLDLRDQNIVDISSISVFNGLASVDISGNYIQNVEVFGYMPYLQVINASRNDLEVFGDFRAPIALEQVNFSRNRINRLVNLEQFWALTEVNLSHNHLTIAEGFENCPHLRVLDLSHNRISNIENLRCPSLIALFLHNNNIDVIMNLEGCPNLRALSLGRNHIQSLEPLRILTRLNELWLESNRIRDIIELQHLKPLLDLNSLFMEPNPVTHVGMWRLMIIHTLPQIRKLDGKIVQPEETVQAKNTFTPSYEKIAFENRVAVMLDRACQPANVVFDDSVYKKSLPPILLIVGPPTSQCYRLTVLLKEKYRTKVLLGGVHSTATTLEFPSTNKDIPVSVESFLGMKQRGEFLAFSHILGRVCGFATSQITRAYERNAILIASVPLGVALTLHKWKLKARMVLVVPSGRGRRSLKISDETPLEPHVLEDEIPHDGASSRKSTQLGTKDPGRSRATSISFAAKREMFDLDLMGDKRPSMDPVRAASVLRSKHPDEVPELPEPFLDMFNSAENSVDSPKSDSAFIFRTKSELLGQRPFTVATGSKGTSPYGSLVDEQLEGRVGSMDPREVVSDTEVLNSSERRSSSQDQMEQIFSAGSKIKLSDEVDREFFTSLSENPQTSEGSSVPPPFTTDGTAAPVRFSTLNNMTKLRRIASLFLQFGGDANLSDVFQNFPTNFDLASSIKNLNWTETLLDIDAPKVPTNENVYYMLFNRCGMTPEELKDPDTVALLRSLRKCCAKSKQGAYELLFLKNSLLNDMERLSTCGKDTKMDDMTCDGVQGRLFGNFQALSQYQFDDGDPISSQPAVNTDAMGIPPPRSQGGGRVPSKLLGLRSAGDRSELSTADIVLPAEDSLPAETTPVSGPLGPDEACRTVVNPNYAFGPHEVCCNNNRISCPATATAQGADLERGTFFDGNFHDNFLDSRSVSDTAVDEPPNEAEENIDEEETPGEVEEEEEESPIHSCGSAPFQPRQQRQSSEYDEYDGEDGPGNMQSAPPPSIDTSDRRSRASSARNSTRQSNGRRTTTTSAEDAITTDEDDESDLDSASDQGTNLAAESGHRKKHNQRAETSILNSLKEYTEFHQENPGFFHTVIDSENIEKCVENLSSMLEEMIEDFKNQKSIKSISYAARNTTDAAQFIQQRLREFRELSTGFSKGITEGATVAMGGSKVIKRPTPPQELSFERSKCPPNLLEPTINRKPRNAKIKRIIQNNN